MTSYYIYARKSTESEDRQALSIDSQINELRQLAQKDNLTVKKVFTESKSAKGTGRPVFNLMLKEIKKAKTAGIICWKLDRLTRNLLDGAIISDLMEKGTIAEIRTPMQIYRNNSVDRLMSGIDMLFARKYVDDLSENVKRGMKAKVEQGWMPGRAPIGYISDRGEQGFRKIIPDTKRFKLVRKMWDLLLTGNYSVPQILDMANNQWGFKTRKTKKQGAVPLSRSTIYKMFSDTFYYGQFYYQGELHQGKHKPIVTLEEYEQVQLILGNNNRAKPERHISTFTGIFRCGLCGSMITAENKEKYIKAINSRKIYTYYHCTFAKDRNCPRNSISETDLTDQIDRYLMAISLPQEYLNWIFKYYNSVQSRELEKIEKEKHNIQKEINNIESKLQNLLSLKISPDNQYDQLISNEDYLKQKNKLTIERTRLSNSYRKYTQDNSELNRLTKELFEFSVYARTWFQKGDIYCKRTIVNKIFQNHLISNSKVLMSVKRPFKLISLLKLPKSMQKMDNRTEDFGLGKTKNTLLLSESTNWYRQLDELGTEIRKMI
ncbi:MAG: recombinase family protein [Bacteroidetes bacterium]|nr:recombinase family protein [Bacteroidota bacterium]